MSYSREIRSGSELQTLKPNPPKGLYSASAVPLLRRFLDNPEETSVAGLGRSAPANASERLTHTSHI